MILIYGLFFPSHLYNNTMIVSSFNSDHDACYIIFCYIKYYICLDPSVQPDMNISTPIVHIISMDVLLIQSHYAHKLVRNFNELSKVWFYRFADGHHTRVLSIKHKIIIVPYSIIHSSFLVFFTPETCSFTSGYLALSQYLWVSINMGEYLIDTVSKIFLSFILDNSRKRVI